MKDTNNDCVMSSFIQEFNSLGWATFPTDVKSKEPLVSNWKDLKPHPFGVPNFSRYDLKEGQYAVKLQPEDLIIDVDPRNFPYDSAGAQINTWKKFIKDYNFDNLDKDTFIVKTGSGGAHIYLKKPADRCIRKKLKDYPGLDFLAGFEGKNAYIIGPGSVHHTGRHYKATRGTLDAIKQAPIELLELLNRDRSTFSIQEDADFSDDDQNKHRFTEYLKESALPAVQGTGGDLQTFKVACRGRDFNLPLNAVYELMMEYYNPICEPPWEPDQLLEKVQNAYKYNEESPGKLDPIYAFNKVEPPKNTEGMDPLLFDCLYGDDNKYDSVGKPDAEGRLKLRATLRNAVKHIVEYPEITNCLRFNSLSRQVEVTGKLPWHLRRPDSEYWTDDDTIQTKFFFNAKKSLEYSTGTLLEAVMVVSTMRIYNPLREYLAHLTWDKTPRLSQWLTTYCGAADSSYTQTVGRKTLIAAVTRAFKPGAKFDHVLVLEGKQGIGKSSVVAILGGEWFGDIFIDPKSKDTVDALQGKWIIELSEMESVRRIKDVQALKAFITRTEDRVRLAYARTTSNFPRQCIFIGTVNPDGLGYLSDSTGNRRFWPVFCVHIDREKLIRDRDQLLAEAVYYYQIGEELFITDHILQRKAEAETEDRVEQDAWVEIIASWDARETDTYEITPAWLYEHVIGAPLRNITSSDVMRIGKALHFLGWYKARKDKSWVFRRDEAKEIEE